MQDGLRRMYGSSDEHPHGEDVFYYLTVYNEPIQHPAEPENVDAEGIVKGLYRFSEGPAGSLPAQILASGVAMPWAVEAQKILAEEWNVKADVWSATSWNELRREAVDCERHNLLHPEEEQRTPYVTRKLASARGPVVAVSDWMRSVPDQIARWVPGTYQSLGADGFGFADTRGGPAVLPHRRAVDRAGGADRAGPRGAPRPLGAEAGDRPVPAAGRVGRGPGRGGRRRVARETAEPPARRRGSAVWCPGVRTCRCPWRPPRPAR